MRDIVSPLDGFRSPFGQMGSFFPAQLFRTGRPGHTAAPLPGYVFSDTAGTTPATLGGTVARVNSPVAGQPHLLMADAPDRLIWGRMPAVGINQLYNRFNTEEPDMGGGGISTPAASWEQNVGLTPGGNSYGRLTKNDSSGANQVSTIFTNESADWTYPAGTQVSLSRVVKADTHDFVRLYFGGPATASTVRAAAFNLATGAVISADAALDAHSITDLGDGFYRISITYTTAATGALWTYLSIATSTGSDFFPGVGTESILTGEPMLNLGLPAAYQRNNIANSTFDVTQSGQRPIYYLQGNGVNQYMATSANVDMTSVSAAAMVAGLEQVGASNALIWHRDGNSDGSLGISSGGVDESRWRAIIRVGGVFHFASATATLPTRKVAAAVSDRSVADFLRIRINGEQIAEEKPGVSGNMLNVPLAIFATSAGSFHSNARWFGHTFCAMTTAELARVEAYHAYLTGETLA